MSLTRLACRRISTAVVSVVSNGIIFYDYVVIGTSQIRRVRLPRIADISGAISYAELEGLVVTFSFPEESPEKYSVSLTYFDVDEDTVTIGSTDELVDAIEQFSGKKVLRISTEVKPKTKSEKKAEKKPAPVDKATQSTQEKPEEERSGSDVHPQIQNLLESFVGVLSTAVGSLQEGLASPESAPKVGQTSAQAAAAASAKKAPPSTDNDEGEVKSKAAPPRDVKEGPSREADSLAAGGSGEKDNAVRPFIHGRHTCDSCLTTPIVGNRYNSKNLPDYDLCENCHKNYKGNDIQFEAVELGKCDQFNLRLVSPLHPELIVNNCPSLLFVTQTAIDHSRSVGIVAARGLW